MVSMLKYIHLTCVLAAVLLFIFSFYWQQRGHRNAHKEIFKKFLLYIHLAILLFALLLMWVEQITLFAAHELWLVEKSAAFIAYLVMVFAALNKEKRREMQFLAFIGAFGWLAYIVKLAISKQAILLVG